MDDEMLCLGCGMFVSKDGIHQCPPPEERVRSVIAWCLRCGETYSFQGALPIPQHVCQPSSAG